MRVQAPCTSSWEAGVARALSETGERAGARGGSGVMEPGPSPLGLQHRPHSLARSPVTVLGGKPGAQEVVTAGFCPLGAQGGG